MRFLVSEAPLQLFFNFVHTAVGAFCSNVAGSPPRMQPDTLKPKPQALNLKHEIRNLEPRTQNLEL